MKTKTPVKKEAVAKKAPAKEKAVKAPKAEKAVKAAVEEAPKVEAKTAKAAKAPVVNASDKQKVIENFAQKKGDTGSPEVQVALLTFKIEKLSQHLNENQKDNHSRRGLLKVVAKRRRIINYLLKLDKARYKTLIEQLGLKK